MLKKNTDSSLISLDAKKAFDLVDHIYIEETLRRYGFAQNFISMFKSVIQIYFGKNYGQWLYEQVNTNWKRSQTEMH